MSHTPRHIPNEATIHKQGFLDKLDADSVVDWLAQNGRNVIYILLGLIALFILVYKISSSNTAKSEKDYLQASTDFSTFVRSNADEASTQEAFTRLTSLMNSHPELHFAYDGAIGQTFLNRGQVAEAKPFIVNTLKRTQAESLMLYNQFAATTLLISEGQFQKALENAQTLQQTMLSDLNNRKNENKEHSFSEVLFAFNLLRVAMLQQELGNSKEELKAWKEWKGYAGLDKTSAQPIAMNPMAFRVIIQQLAIGNIALPDYIAYREKILK